MGLLQQGRTCSVKEPFASACGATVPGPPSARVASADAVSSSMSTELKKVIWEPPLGVWGKGRGVGAGKKLWVWGRARAVGVGQEKGCGCGAGQGPWVQSRVNVWGQEAGGWAVIGSIDSIVALITWV